MNDEPADETLIRLPDFARALGVSRRTIERLLKDGLLTSIRRRRHGYHYFTPEQLERLKCLAPKGTYLGPALAKAPGTSSGTTKLDAELNDFRFVQRILRRRRAVSQHSS